jgi:hypothetical protein
MQSIPQRGERASASDTVAKRPERGLGNKKMKRLFLLVTILSLIATTAMLQTRLQKDAAHRHPLGVVQRNTTTLLQQPPPLTKTVPRHLQYNPMPKHRLQSKKQIEQAIPKWEKNGLPYPARQAIYNRQGSCASTDFLKKIANRDPNKQSKWQYVVNDKLAR